MHRVPSPSPIFETPELPALRKVKPLPKRRRISDQPVSDGQHKDPRLDALQAQRELTSRNSLSSTLSNASPPLSIAVSTDEEPRRMYSERTQTGGVPSSPYSSSSGGLEGSFKSATAHPSADEASDVFGGNSIANQTPPRLYALPPPPSPNADAARYTNEDEDDMDRSDGDYSDFRQPNNAKKRKVPANVSSISRRHDSLERNSGSEEDSVERFARRGFDENQADLELETLTDGKTPPPTNLQKRGKLSPATYAGLQHKEMLKARKRQLAAVLGALSHGDSLALDQALALAYPTAASALLSGVDVARATTPPRVHLSKRSGPRAARVFKKLSLPRHPDGAPFPQSDFSYTKPSETSERLMATKEEVKTLREKFEEELLRQASKSAKLAATDRAVGSASVRGRSKRSDRAKQRTRMSISSKADVIQPEVEPQAPVTPPRPKGKKKKRSALANASNPHHLRNYVPSRLPHSTPAGMNQAQLNSLNEFGSFPLRFLSAEVPPKRGKVAQVAPTTQLTNPADEWICAICEYQLFYGDDLEYRRAIKNRKKILRRRRRARERAAAAASGSGSAVKPADRGDFSDDEYDDEYDDGPAEFAPIPADVRAQQQAMLARDDMSGHSGSFG